VHPLLRAGHFSILDESCINISPTTVDGQNYQFAGNCYGDCHFKATAKANATSAAKSPASLSDIVRVPTFVPRNASIDLHFDFSLEDRPLAHNSALSDSTAPKHNTWLKGLMGAYATPPPELSAGHIAFYRLHASEELNVSPAIAGPSKRVRRELRVIVVAFRADTFSCADALWTCLIVV
jgi:hypothetical protein